MKVSDLIGRRTEIYSIPEDKSVLDAAQYLREKQLRSAGVVSAGGELIGVVSQSDVSDKVAAENKCPAWDEGYGNYDPRVANRFSISDI